MRHLIFHGRYLVTSVGMVTHNQKRENGSAMVFRRAHPGLGDYIKMIRVKEEMRLSQESLDWEFHERQIYLQR